MISNRLYLTVGTKLEHDYYNGLGAMPTGRLAWNISARQMAWASASRALQIPSATDASIQLNFGEVTPLAGPPIEFARLGNPNIEDEALLAYEAGYRASFTDRFSLDWTAYYNRYTHLDTLEPISPFLEDTPPPARLVAGTAYGNLMNGETHGFELFGDWKVLRRWTLEPGYALELIHMRLAATSGDTASVPDAQGGSPRNSAQVRSHLALTTRLGWDASAYFVGRLTAPSIPAYARVDTGLSWQCSERFAISVVGQNLLSNTHLEFIDLSGSTPSALMKRSGYLKAVWTF
jgi:iron complex outermembrane receptor protein